MLKINFNKSFKEKENKVLKYFYNKHKNLAIQLPKYKKRTKKQTGKQTENMNANTDANGNINASITTSTKLTKIAPENSLNKEKKQIVKMD